MKQAWIIAAALVLSGAASAQDAKPDAVVGSVEGSVQLPSGTVLANGGSAGVNEGQTIQVTGSAPVTYSNGCQATVQDSAYTINEPGCVPPGAIVGGVHQPVAAYVVAGLGVAAAVAASVAGGGSDDKPSSP